VEEVATIGTINWTEAKCATGDARLLHLFFSEEQAEIAEAKAICQTCPLRLPCLEGAIERGEPWGVWGGQLFDRGQVIERKRRRGRPRKDEVRETAVVA
jgi:WhiB family redox-sensing transcriptional regulator